MTTKEIKSYLVESGNAACNLQVTKNGNHQLSLTVKNNGTEGCLVFEAQGKSAVLPEEKINTVLNSFTAQGAQINIV